MKTKRIIKKILYIVIVSMLYIVPMPIFAAENLASPHYQIINPELDSGGSTSASTNYRSYDSIGQTGDTKLNSTNYNAFPGLILPLSPNVPNAPTFQNTTGTLYNALDFVINTDYNTTDVNYALAISSDNFTTTQYIQASDSMGTSIVWQSYTNWGGSSGQRIVLLAPNTTYKLKVKARYGLNSETAYSAISTAATTNPTLTVTIAGVSSGTVVAGATTNISTTAAGVGFGTLSSGMTEYAAHTLTVSTNATSGYSTTVQESSDLSTTSGYTIPPVAGTNASPVTWPSGITTAAFGYHTTKNPLCSGTTTRFSANNSYAAFTTSPLEISCKTGPVTSDQATMLYRIEIDGQQVPGNYSDYITYITTAQY